MRTLYDIVGALADDDAEDLRVAFRKAVKANHPDVNPDNPEAAQAFRRIVRANAILSDERQRAAYDRLLATARQQQRQESKPKRGMFSAGIRRLGFDAIAVAIASVVFIGGYFLLKPVNRLASAHVSEIARSEPAPIAAVGSSDFSSRERTEASNMPAAIEAGTKPDIEPQHLKEPIREASVSPAVTTSHAAAETDVSPAAEGGPRDVRYYRERGATAYRSGDLAIALVNFDLAIEHDPACADCYVDRGIVLNRMGDQKRAFADVSEARRIDALNRSKAPSGAGAH